jgi:hypothetical protein
MMYILRKTGSIILITILLMLFLSLSLSALEIKEGRIKLVLHENLGKVTAYYLTDIGKNTFTPLFFSQDPSTTSLSILLDNKVYRMGESSAFRQTIERTDRGAKFVWKSSSFVVTEEFSFINSSNSPITNGFVIKVTAENISESAISAEVRYIIDTYLGEDSGVHFRTDSIDRVSGETSFTKYTLPAYILSPAASDRFNGLQIMTDTSGITLPDKLVLANWKRLNDSTWGYNTRSTRNFNYSPYSFNDSGVAMYYNLGSIRKSGKKEIVIAMGGYTETGFSVKDFETKSEIADVYDKSLDSVSSQTDDVDLSVQTDLLTINELLARINKQLKSEIETSQDELEIMSKVIEELEKRKARYDAK